MEPGLFGMHEARAPAFIDDTQLYCECSFPITSRYPSYMHCDWLEYHWTLHDTVVLIRMSTNDHAFFFLQPTARTKISTVGHPSWHLPPIDRHNSCQISSSYSCIRERNRPWHLSVTLALFRVGGLQSPKIVSAGPTTLKGDPGPWILVSIHHPPSTIHHPISLVASTFLI